MSVPYRVDVKAFFSVPVTAPNEAEARKAADAFIERIMGACGEAIAGYNEGNPDKTARIGNACCIGDSVQSCIEGESEVETE